jgi:23S rRNA (adenine2503-C2)-methyltransferase
MVWFTLFILNLSLASALQFTAGQRIAPRSGRRIDECKSLFNLPAVEEWASKRDLKEHHLKTLYKTVMASSQDDNLEQRLLDNSFPRQHAADLANEFQLCTSSLVQTHPSSSGGKKLVIELQSGAKIETVIIRHETTRGVRYTVCVSSQVGCARACTFCATGTMNLQAQLPSAAILEQVWLASSTLDHPVRNVVFMGMGESFDNWYAVHEACRGLTHQCLFGLAAKQVTVSTVGASPYHIRLLAEECPQISLALSLHGATQELRKGLMPHTAPLQELEAALDYHAEQTGQRIMIEYLLIDGVNDSDEAANALVRFCQARRQMPFVNLIPYNPTIAGVKFGYTTPSDDQINKFHERLVWQGIRSIVRWTSAAGRDAGGACGQLIVSSS